jgi:hypothetical protein
VVDFGIRSAESPGPASRELLTMFNMCGYDAPFKGISSDIASI